MLNADDAVCRSFAELTRRADGLVQRRATSASLMPPAEVPIPGTHNAENVMAAAAAAEIAGVAKRDIAAAVRTFKAVEHRLEFVAEIDGVRFYNDSKATSVDATMKALDSFRRQTLGDSRRQRQRQRLHGAARSAAAESARGAADRRGGRKRSHRSSKAR